MKRQEGHVKWFNEEKGFGFIERNGENDIFVHYKEIDSEGRRTLLEGQLVSFIVGETDKGVQATQVIVLS
jgi:CspA family cold shock protein